MDIARAHLRNQLVASACLDLFSLIVYLRESKDFEPLDPLFEKIVGRINAMEKKAESLKVADRDIEDAKYVLVALIDEIIAWQSRLELKFFDSNIAGVEFFARLERLKEAGRTGVLVIYYLCLIFGFEGKHAIRNPEKIGEYIKEFLDKLPVQTSQALAPQAERTEETKMRLRREIPSWLPWAINGASAVVTGIVFLILKLRIADLAEGVANQIQGFLF